MILSPMPKGNGAYVLHKSIEQHLDSLPYKVYGYSPFLSLLPIILPLLVKPYKPKLIHTSPDYSIFFHKKSSHMVITFHNYVLDQWMKRFSSTIQWIHYKTDLRFFTKVAIYRADIITAVSQYTADLVHKDLNVTIPIKVIYNGIDTDVFTPPIHKKNNRVQVLYSGNLTTRKGAHWLPGIAKRLKNRIRIYYTQGLRTRLNLPQKKSLVPIGPVPYNDMPRRYQDMDILIMPTIREGFSLSVLEAMASGLPVVASSCSSLPEQIDDGKGGFLCPIGDVDAFAEKINILADSPTLRKEMGEYNRAKVEKMFTVQRMVKEYEKLFEKVLSET